MLCVLVFICVGAVCPCVHLEVRSQPQVFLLRSHPLASLHLPSSGITSIFHPTLIFTWTLGLNSVPHACKASTFPRKLSLEFLEIEVSNIFLQLEDVFRRHCIYVCACMYTTEKITVVLLYPIN